MLIKEGLPTIIVNIKNWANKDWKKMKSLAKYKEVISSFFFL